uniref:DUF4268 domain-containing protein n=1 Tax=Halalkalicoccus subterraneus TaxID=2675002 RepID=UPI000EFBCADC
LTEAYSQRRPDWYKLTPQPQSWQVFGAGIGGLSLGWAFHQGPEFAVEFYIDTSDKKWNETIYDALKQHQEEIQMNLADLDKELVWQRFPEKRACRIKCPYSIPHKFSELSAEEREQLVRWGVETMDQFQDEFERRIADLAI